MLYNRLSLDKSTINNYDLYMAQENTPSGPKVFIARQPIFDRTKNVYAYELVYRSDNKADVMSENGDHSALKVIANSLMIGLQKLTQGKRAFISFNRRLLLGNMPHFFPSEILGIEIQDAVEPEEPVLKICTRLKKNGYLIILDNFTYREEYQPWIDLADVIKIDFKMTLPAEVKKIIQKINSPHIKFMAYKIDSQAEFDEAFELGFSYFQGYFFQSPSFIFSPELPGYKVNYLSILKKLYDPESDMSELEPIIKRDVSITYKLLRFINSAAFGFKVAIRSVHHAMMLLGKREIKRWLTIIVMSGIGHEKPMELMNTAVIRARFCELIGTGFSILDHPSDLFLIGMFSMADAFLDKPIAEVLEDLPLEDHIKSVLLGAESQSGDILKLVKAFEKADWENVTLFSKQLDFNEEKLADLYLDAVEWTKLFSS